MIATGGDNYTFQYVFYQQTHDWPDFKYQLRPFFIGEKTDENLSGVLPFSICCVGNDLNELKEPFACGAHFVWLDRHENDDPVIVGVYV